MNWPAVVARARGLRSRLVRRDELEALASVGDLSALARALTERGLLPETPAEPVLLELAVRRRAGRWLAVLARWGAALPARWRDVLAPVVEDEDRRSIRALIRGAAAAAPPEERIAGLLPSPSLPERALRELAGQPSVGGVVALLVAWGHPAGGALSEEARRPQPDLLRLDAALARWWAERARGIVARRLLPVPLRRELAGWVRHRIDVENVLAALVLAGRQSSEPADPHFLPGGRRLDRRQFAAAAASSDPTAAALTLSAGAFHGTPLGAILEQAASRSVAIDDALLRADLRTCARRARVNPLGFAPVLGALLALRAEARDLRRLIWGVALGRGRTMAHDLLTAP